MEIRRERTFFRDYVLREQEFRRICDTLFQQIKQLAQSEDDIVTQFILHTVDNHSNEGTSVKESIEEVFTLDNGDTWNIESLEIKYFLKDKSSNGKVTLKFNSFRGAIYYEIVGRDREWLYITASMIDERIDKIFTFSFSTIGNYVIYLILGVLFVNFAVVASVIRYGTNPPGFKFVIMDVTLLLLLLAAVITCKVFFPRCTFYWGDHMKAYDRKVGIGKNILNILFISFVLGVIASIFATILLS